MSPLFIEYQKLDRSLARAGVPATSPFWLAEIERFYAAPTARLLVECVGRAGAKTMHSVKMAIVETLSGEFNIAPGEVHYFVMASVGISEASKTLDIVASYLRILKVPFDRKADVLELTGRPRGIRVLASKVGAVSGYRCFGWSADEAAKWPSDGVDPSQEVIASLRAMSVTHPNARGRIFSSPLARSGYFYDQWVTGDTDYQLAGHAPSWVANPSITEVATRALEPHEPTRLREYGAVASAGSASALDAADIEAMVRPIPDGARDLGRPMLVIDTSMGADSFAWLVARFISDRGVRRLVVEKIGAFEAGFAKTHTFDQIIDHLASVARRVGARAVIGDSFMSFACESAFGARGLQFTGYAWSLTTKLSATSTLRQLLRERAILAEPGHEGERLKREMNRLTETVLASGAMTITSPRSAAGHGDRCACVLLVAHAISIGDFLVATASGKPLGESRFATVTTKFQTDHGPTHSSHQPTPGTQAPRVPGGPQFSHGYTGPASGKAPRGGWFI